MKTITPSWFFLSMNPLHQGELNMLSEKIAPSFNPMQLSTLGDLIHLFLALSLVLLLFWFLFLYIVLC